MKTIAIMNNKGGVGKTVTAINLADILVREHGKRVVLCDCDGQRNLTDFFLTDGFDEDVCYTTVSMLLGDGEPVWSDNLMPIYPGLDLIPASSDLYAMDLESHRDGNHSPMRIKRFVDAARADRDTDFFIFDCPPGFTLSSVGALMAADEVIVPLTVDGFSVRGVETMRKQLSRLRRVCSPGRIRVLITQWNNSNAVKQGEELLRRGYHIGVFNTVIRRTVSVPESTFARQTLLQYSRRSTATQDYRALAREILGV